MKILAVGDVVGRPGTDMLAARLPALKKELGVDFCIVNAENADESGTGVTTHIAQELFAYGANVITTGNHALRRAHTELFEQTPALLCPANAYYTAPASGVHVYDMGRRQIAVVNLVGTAFLGPAANPFTTLDEILKTLPTKLVVVDFHAESTAEKKALAYHAASRVSVLFGTHTHVQTSDATILDGHTGYITDLGMTGPLHSVLGVETALAIEKQKTQGSVRFKVAQGPCSLEGALFDIDEDTARCTKVQTFRYV
ncbi:YmdB family metallophosphoesterase [Ruminococcaceae bacterium OttesenSCG-928-N02]|nr:YmdB family metallophosphoesterase [Ruminococcaceae bacterium OttesenSCG-928-N02]